MLTSSGCWLKLTVSFTAHRRKVVGRRTWPLSQVFLLAEFCTGHWCVSLLIV